MDLETENRIASILLKEAAELRRQAEKEGINVYLRQPQVRYRPNSRFLTATVLGVQQANRDVEVNEMWRVRQKELELNDKLKRKSKDGGDRGKVHKDTESRSRDWGHDNRASSSCSLSKRTAEVSCSQEGDGLRDEEVEEFLHSRAKRGRGSIGSRMDETGPYLPSSDSPANPCSSQTPREERIVLGPEKPPSLKSLEYFSDEEAYGRKNKKVKKASSKCSEKHSRKHKSQRDKSRDKKKKRQEGRKKCADKEKS